jgi:hypothetical protein
MQFLKTHSVDILLVLILLLALGYFLFPYVVGWIVGRMPSLG